MATDAIRDTGRLVLTRRPGECIDIGTDVEVMVVAVRGDKVRIGVRAPADLPVHRREVTEARRQSGQADDDLAALSWREMHDMLGSSIELLRALYEDEERRHVYDRLMSLTEGIDGAKKLREAVER